MRALASKVAKPLPTSAKEAVEEGLAAFNERKDYAEALRLFRAAMELKPTEEEAIAALYNAGCAHAKRKEFREAADSILTAVNDYNLKLSVALAVRVWRSTRVRVCAARALLLPLQRYGVLCGPLAPSGSAATIQLECDICNHLAASGAQTERHIARKQAGRHSPFAAGARSQPTMPPPQTAAPPIRTRTCGSCATPASGLT